MCLVAVVTTESRCGSSPFQSAASALQGWEGSTQVRRELLFLDKSCFFSVAMLTEMGVKRQARWVEPDKLWQCFALARCQESPTGRSRFHFLNVIQKSPIEYWWITWLWFSPGRSYSSHAIQNTFWKSKKEEKYMKVFLESTSDHFCCV